MHRLLTTLLVAVIASLALASSSTAAEPTWGDLDPSFGSGGILQLQAEFLDVGDIRSLAVQPDGKILAAGTNQLGGKSYGVVWRLLPHGAKDPSFANNGVFVFPNAHTEDSVTVESVKLQPDGKILGVGGVTRTGTKHLIFRLNRNGTLDTDSDATPSSCFGPACAGSLTESVATGDSQYSDLMTMPGGDIVAAGGYVDGADAARLLIRRFDSSGAPVGAYNTAADAATAAVEAASFDGRVRVLGYGDSLVFNLTSATKKFSAVRVMDDGAIAPDYGTNGVTSIGSNVTLADAIIRYGVITSAGSAEMLYPSSRLALGRLDSFGDPSTYGYFANGGALTHDIIPGSPSSAIGLRAYQDDSMLALGQSIKDGAPYVTTTALAANASIFGAYGNNGTMSYPALGAASTAGALELLSDGKAILAGTMTRNGQVVPFVARILGQSSGVKLPSIPESAVSSPINSRIKAKRLQKFRGTAGPAGQVAKVEIALNRAHSGLLKKEKHCLWLRSSRAKFTKTRATSRRCATQWWLTALGADNWSYSLLRKLPKGRYVLHVRATLTDGTVQAAPTIKHFKVT